MPQKPPRSMVVIGNWKMYKTIDEARAFLETLTPLLEKSQVLIYLTVPFTAIQPTVKRIEELDLPFLIGAQNMNDASEGAFTGEVAAQMLIEVGAQFVILGHSERRHFFNESDSFINKKVKRALLEGIEPILCIGEQREDGETKRVLEEQILSSLEGILAEDMQKLMLAYEPVWAIGTGKVAEPGDAQAVHAFIRGVIAREWGQEVADQLSIQYGGSVGPENAFDLISQIDIDGLLVGGASLSPHSFSQIINGLKK